MNFFCDEDLYRERLQIARPVHEGLAREYSHRPSSV